MARRVLIVQCVCLRKRTLPRVFALEAEWRALVPDCHRIHQGETVPHDPQIFVQGHDATMLDVKGANGIPVVVMIQTNPVNL